MTTLDLVTSIIAVLAGISFIAYVIREAVRGAPERRAEERARDYFDRHGRWPDEPDVGA
jgi:hypothetical protein